MPVSRLPRLVREHPKRPSPYDYPGSGVVECTNDEDLD